MSVDGRLILTEPTSDKSVRGAMITSIQIRGYRGFEEFEMNDLGRVNLLVGKNNSGKTSVLEAIYLLVSRGDPNALWSVLWRRGERSERPSQVPDLDVCHIFKGHEIGLGSKFSFVAKNQEPERTLAVSIGEITTEQSHSAASRENATVRGVNIPSRLGLHFKGNPAPQVQVVPLSRTGGISAEALELPRRLRGRTRSVDEESPAQFITTESVDGNELVTLWNSIALTQSEDRVMQALRFIEPKIERIAAQAGTQGFYGGANYRGGFIAKMNNSTRPVPIGSLGDGIWRMLAMAIAISQCKDGVLLIDEIDTGLHHTVMTDMWKLIYGAATDLNVQVFATTHSFDCVHSLAKLCVNLADDEPRVTLQRVEVGKRSAIPYSAEEIIIAAKENIEVR
jgi:AAA ATPase domain